MRTRSPSDLGRLLQGAPFCPADALSDAQLLHRFCRERDGDAFAALVRRHGSLVLGVCQRHLRHTQEAEDAFQATFLVLVRKAAALHGRDTLAGFLYAVASRTARKARCLAARRLRKEAEVAARSPAAGPPGDPPDLDTELLDRELHRLPERYRLPVLLCDLEGKSRKEAAGLLGCSEGTLSGRLARARKRLAERLRPAGAVGVPCVTIPAVAPALLEATVRAAAAFAAGGAEVPVAVLTLAHGVMKTMFLAKLQKAALGVTAAAGVGLALWGVAVLAAPAPAPVIDPPAKAAEAAPVNLSLVPGHLLQDRKVLRELKTTADQRDAIADRLEAAEEAAQKILTGFQPDAEKADEAVQADVEKMYRQIEGVMQGAARKAIQDVLDRKQQARLVQVALQAAGPEVFQEPAVVKALGLTAEQRQKVAGAIRTADEAVEKLFTPGDPEAPLNPDAYSPEALRKISDDAKKAIVAGLTEGQRQTWKAMTGEPINFVPRPADGMFFDFAGPRGGLAAPVRALPFVPPPPPAGGAVPPGGGGVVPPDAVPPTLPRRGEDPVP